MGLRKKSYKAIDIAKYIINRSIDIEKPISNLKLQKVLYFIQGEFLSKLNKPAFSEEIQAWRHGPVVPEVYYEFNKYIASDITQKYSDTIETKFEKVDIDIINQVIDDTCDYSAWELVEITHEQFPWSHNYTKGKNSIISKDDIKQYFCSCNKMN